VFPRALRPGILNLPPSEATPLSSPPTANQPLPRREPDSCSLSATLAQLRGLIRKLEPDPATVNPIAIEPPARSLRRMQIEG
jgi:hypothetical protein